MYEIEIFVQGEGIPTIILVRVPSNGTVQDILRSAETQGVRFADDERVMHVAANNWGAATDRYLGYSYAFTSFGPNWCWGTWRRAWARVRGPARVGVRGRARGRGRAGPRRVAVKPA